jgi:hypothetical protein
MMPQKYRKRAYLVDLTEELEAFDSGSYIEEFVEGGHKTMHLLCFYSPQRNVHMNIK